MCIPILAVDTPAVGRDFGDFVAAGGGGRVEGCSSDHGDGGSGIVRGLVGEEGAHCG